MKTLLTSIATLTALSVSAGTPSTNTSMHPDTMKAIECRPAATAIAKMNMDQKAKSYKFDSADVAQAVFRKSEQGKHEKTYIYSAESYIYKGSYTTYVEVDSSCSVVTVLIKENL